VNPTAGVGDLRTGGRGVGIGEGALVSPGGGGGVGNGVGRGVRGIVGAVCARSRDQIHTTRHTRKWC
jgi:hypothetical protein